MKKEEREIYKKAIIKWGVNAQIDMLIEEMAELIQALLKIRRDAEKREAIFNVYEEMADVEIMLEQLHLIFHADKMVSIYKIGKLERLEERINKTEGEK